MRIAVPYEDGNVFQHFGRTENFKIYDIDGGEIVGSQVINCGGTGHEALAGLLAGQGVDTLICGGLGEGAMNALREAGIQVYPGASGSTDEAVAAFLDGELETGEANCDHHHEEESEEGCQENCGGGCGGGCGGCAGCGERPVILEGKNAGKTVRVHYKGTFNDGTQFDSSYDRGEPLEYVCGTGMMIPGFDAAVVDMEVGDSVDVHLMPEDAYGMPDPSRVLDLKIAELPGSEDLSVGQKVYLSNSMGQSFPVVVTAKDEENITLDANHEMAGKELNFHIELLSSVGD
ncbi:MAG: NifB/NifX family molybdenum-iron cluster-binding protein [Lachnospiraceae bacterium]|jgi:FKBP-type peptidyl-prolyl cis-trans isomerase 2/predicted Fe-Mo cluster-binding NifX family protein